MKELDLQLLMAIRTRNLGRVRRCIEAGADVTAIFVYQLEDSTMLQIAANCNCNIEIIRLLLTNPKMTSEAVNRRDRNGNTALSLAAIRGNIEAVAALLASDKVPAAEVLRRDLYGNTVLGKAARKGHTGVVHALLASDKMPAAEVNRRDLYGNTVLSEAARKGHTGVVHTLLASGKLPVSEVVRRDRNGYTALDIAKSKGHTGVVLVLGGGPFWHPRNHSGNFKLIRILAATLRMGVARLYALGPDGYGRSLPWPLWGGDVMPHVNPTFMMVEELAGPAPAPRPRPSGIMDRNPPPPRPPSPPRPPDDPSAQDRCCVVS